MLQPFLPQRCAQSCHFLITKMTRDSCPMAPRLLIYSVTLVVALGSESNLNGSWVKTYNVATSLIRDDGVTAGTTLDSRLTWWIMLNYESWTECCRCQSFLNDSQQILLGGNLKHAPKPAQNGNGGFEDLWNLSNKLTVMFLWLKLLFANCNNQQNDEWPLTIAENPRWLCWILRSCSQTNSNCCPVDIVMCLFLWPKVFMMSF